MELSPEILDTHRDLGEIPLRFVDFVRRNPDWARDLDGFATDFPAWAKRLKYHLHPWPLLAGGKKLAEVRRASLGVVGLVKSIPERIFDNDPRRVSEFYHLPNPMLTSLFLEKPNGIPGWFCRGDFVDSGRGFYCFEINMKAYIGGWHLRFWQEEVVRSPKLAAFFAEVGARPTFQDPPRAMFEHVIRDTLAQGMAREGELNVAFVLPSDLDPAAYPTEHFTTLHRDALTAVDPGLSGRVLFPTYPAGLTLRDRLLHVGAARVHAVVEHTAERTPREVYRAFKTGKVTLYNGPLSNALSDKRNLALLSQHEESDRFSAAEREMIRASIPWSRTVVAGRTTHRGEEIDLLPFLRARREELVLKSGMGSQGSEVLVGRHKTPEEWDGALHAAVSDGGWMVQEHVASRPYLYHDYASPPGPDTLKPHDVIWGIFCFGQSDGGILLRMLPQGVGDGVINSSRGAPMSFLLEV